MYVYIAQHLFKYQATSRSLCFRIVILRKF